MRPLGEQTKACRHQSDRALSEIDGAAIHLDALDRYRKTKVHFVDCLIAATAATEDMPVASFDQDFRKFTDVRVETE